MPKEEDNDGKEQQRVYGCQIVLVDDVIVENMFVR